MRRFSSLLKLLNYVELVMFQFVSRRELGIQAAILPMIDLQEQCKLQCYNLRIFYVFQKPQEKMIFDNVMREVHMTEVN